MRKSAWSWWLCLCLGLWWAPAASAQEEEPGGEEAEGPLRVDAEVAFEGFYRPGDFVTVRALIQNRGAARRVDVAVEAFGVDRAVALDLPAGASREVSLTFPTPALARGWRVVVREQGGGARLGGAAPRLQRISNGQGRAVAFLGKRPPGLKDPALDFIEADVSELDLLDLEASGGLRVARATPEALPDAWLGYSALDALLWADPRPDQLSGAQLEALRRWVLEGGHLVVAVDEQWQALGQSALAPLLPATPEGVEVISRQEAAHPWLQAEGRGQETLPRLKASPKEGAQEEPGGASLGWSWAVGDGRVTLWRVTPGRLGVTPGLEEWKAALLDRGAALPLRSGWELVFQDEPTLEINIFVILAVLLLFLMLIGPVDYLVLRRLRRLEWTLATYPATVLVFGGLTWAAMVTSVRSESLEAATEVVSWHLPAAALRGSAALTRARPDAGLQRWRGLSGYFPTSRERVRLESPEGAEALWRPAVERWGGPGVDQPQRLEGSPPRLETVAAAYAMLPLEVLSARQAPPEEAPVLIEVESLEAPPPPPPAPEPQLDQDGAPIPVEPAQEAPFDIGGQVYLTNQTGAPLERCWWRQGDYAAAAYVSLPPGARVHVPKLVYLRGATQFNYHSLVTDWATDERMLADLFGNLPARGEPARAGRGELVCVGAASAPQVALALGASEQKVRRIWRFLY